MPDKRRHRGPHPLDEKLFAPQNWDILRAAIGDYSWLLERGYAVKSALQLVGNRFRLHARQRLAVLRCSCAVSAQRARKEREVSRANWRGRDGCLRDMASLHGNFRSVEETAPAVILVGEWMQKCGVARAVWWLDSPVSNSGRLKCLLEQIAAERGWDWQVHLAFDADAALKKLDEPGLVVSADSVILDNAGAWANLAGALVEAEISGAWMVDLSGANE